MTATRRLGALLARYVTGLVLAASAIVGVQSATVAPAQASATGCSDWGNIPYISVPSGYMCFTVYGSGLRLDNMRATWRTGSLCSWRIDFIAYNRSNQQIWKSTGPTTSGCTSLSGGRLRSSALTGSAGGKICARVYSYNEWLTGVCFATNP